MLAEADLEVGYLLISAKQLATSLDKRKSVGIQHTMPESGNVVKFPLLMGYYKYKKIAAMGK